MRRAIEALREAYAISPVETCIAMFYLATGGIMLGLAIAFFVKALLE